MRDGPTDERLRKRDVETTTVAGVEVPTTCTDRIDAGALASAVAVLEEYNATEYTVSPVGGLQVRLGIHRPARVHDALRDSLRRVGDGVTGHGVADGFRRLRVDVTTSANDGDGITDRSSERE